MKLPKTPDVLELQLSCASRSCETEQEYFKSWCGRNESALSGAHNTKTQAGLSLGGESGNCPFPKGNRKKQQHIEPRETEVKTGTRVRLERKK